LDLSSIQGRWYFRSEDAAVDVEQYIDVNEELLFQAVHFRKGGGRYKSRQAVLTIEKLEVTGGELVIDLRVTRCIEDGRDVTEAIEGKLVRGRGKRDELVLFLSLPEPGQPRPSDLSDARRFEKRGSS
jgi:hypothetical protein